MFAVIVDEIYVPDIAVDRVNRGNDRRCRQIRWGPSTENVLKTKLFLSYKLRERKERFFYYNHARRVVYKIIQIYVFLQFSVVNLD